MFIGRETNFSQERGAYLRRTLLLSIVACSSFLLAPFRLEAVPNSPVEIMQQVQGLIQQGDIAGARSRLTQALQAFPQEAGLYNLFGVVEARQGNYPEAESNFKKAIERAPQLTGAYLNATKSLIGHGLSAAGTVEVITTLLQMQAGHLHPTRNLENPIDSTLNWVKHNSISHTIENALTLSMGFGGINTALCWQSA